jgi:hypothetical protein
MDRGWLYKIAKGGFAQAGEAVGEYMQRVLDEEGG